MYAMLLYDTLHNLDNYGMEYIVLETPPDNEEWLAIGITCAGRRFGGNN